MRTPLLLFPLLLTACGGLTCNLMYAPDNVEVEVSASSWEPGAYEVEAMDEICSFVLPADGGPSCTGTVLGVELTDDGSGIAHITLYEAAPDAFDLVIRVDGAELLVEEVVPTYTEDEPNGEGCGVRRSGTATVALD